MKEATRVHERGEQELQELWDKFKSTGDPAAREGLILHYSALVKFVAGRIGAGLPNSVDPGDLVSSGVFGLIDAIDRYDPEKVNFRAWIFRVAKNVLLEAMRKLRADPRLRMEGGPSTRRFVIQNCPDNVTLMSARMRRDERIKIFTGYVEELESPDREILVHCGLEGLKAQEVADRLELNREAVIKRWQRLRETLRNNGMLKGIIIDEEA